MNVLRWLWAGPRALFVGIITLIVKLYRWVVRPLLPPLCRFEPSCSEYMLQAVRKYGPVCGAYKGIRRICRCNPWHPGGYDPP